MICFVCFVFFLSSSMSYARVEGDPTKSTAPNSSKINKITFNPSDLIVSDKGNGRWGIIDEANQNRMIFLHSKREYAEAALKVINHYAISEKYIINKWEFFVALGNPPATVYPGEKSLSFDPTRVTMEKRERPAKDQTKDPTSYWALMDGKKQIFGGVITYWRKGVIDPVTQSRQEIHGEWSWKCREWSGKTFVVETADLIVEYPDFADRNAAEEHAATIQRIFDKFIELYSFTKDDNTFKGKKVTIHLFKLGNQSQAFFSNVYINVIHAMPNNSPDRTYAHELGHSFQDAQRSKGRRYIYNVFSGMTEAMAMHFECYINDTITHSRDSYCQKAMSGHMYQAAPEQSLAYYESKKMNPYELDWTAHPVQKRGESFRSGEWYFLQMLYRITGKYGWQIWPKYFAMTVNGGNMSIPKNYRIKELGDPMAKRAFAEFVDTLSKACGDDLRPQFRAWGFDL